ncbi:MAG: uracil-DNA glycosylase [Bacilli bacterium]|nr:uracil-DNA glycosylase [Bacilli bacterium]MDD4282223.1 uracil-DNA glycosylase [Bacilli bacterium]MDD4718222.1 uracil-DNA glycosylase [Bacilli bacterium]
MAYKKHKINITNNKWDDILQEEYKKEYFQQLISFIKREYKNKTIFPEFKDIFNALMITDYEDVKVLILGQDPYHGINQAHGLSFSVYNNQKRPPSLRNIFKELEADLGIKRNDNNLTDWALQGVLLLNSILTVEEGKPLSHKSTSWEVFTDNIIKALNDKSEPIIFVLWGNYAKSKKNLITNKQHIIIEGTHPSPLSANRGFLGSKPFSKINLYLERKGNNKVKW